MRYETHRLFFAKGQAFCSMRFELFSVPSDHPLPLILMIDVFDSSPDNIDHPQLSESLKRRLPYPEITRQGYAVAVVHTNDLCNDCPRTYTRGIMDIAPREGEHGWGTIGAWAWGVSRVVDHVWNDPRVRPRKDRRDRRIPGQARPHSGARHRTSASPPSSPP